MRKVVYISVILVFFAMMKYWASVAAMLGLGAQLKPATTAQQRFVDDAETSIRNDQLEGIEREMVALTNTATDPSQSMEDRKAALQKLKEKEKAAQDITGVTTAREAVKSALESRGTGDRESNLRSIRHVGWSGGSAQNNVQWVSLSGLPQVVGDNVVIRYNWKGGTLNGNLLDHVCKGSWSQEGGTGEFELNFNSDFTQAEGWWSDAGQPQHYYFALR